KEYELVLELASVMSGVFSDESQRADAFRCWLELFFDNEIGIRPEESNEAHQSSRIGERRTDGILLLNLEVKPEPGTNGDCYIQNDAYYKEFVIKSRPNISISGAVCAPFIVCDRLTDIYPLDIITYDNAKADDVARVFLALKNSIHLLKDYYNSVYESREIPCKTSPWFPRINNIDLEEGTATIKYKEKHSIYRNLWVVEIQTENTQEKDLRDENIMAKYKNGEIDIKFVDFDWAGREGEAKYPE
ncbi:3741_t:CDS:2, partial [Racocetra fulgida]